MRVDWTKGFQSRRWANSSPGSLLARGRVVSQSQPRGIVSSIFRRSCRDLVFLHVWSHRKHKLHMLVPLTHTCGCAEIGRCNAIVDFYFIQLCVLQVIEVSTSWSWGARHKLFTCDAILSCKEFAFLFCCCICDPHVNFCRCVCRCTMRMHQDFLLLRCTQTILMCVVVHWTNFVMSEWTECTCMYICGHFFMLIIK